MQKKKQEHKVHLNVDAALSVNVFFKKKHNSTEWKIFSKNSCKFTQCTVMCLLCCVHASFPARLKITQISGTSGSQVGLSVYLSDCLARHFSEALVPSTH